MLNGTTLRITPIGQLAEALDAKAQAALPREPGRSSTRRRKKRVELLSPVSNAAYELIWTEVGKSEWDQRCAYTISGRPVDLLLGINSLAENILSPTLDPMLGLFKHAIRQQFPDLDPDLLDELSLEHCTVSQVEAFYAFMFPSEAEAVSVFEQLFTHSKVMLDGVEHIYNSSKKTTPNCVPMVHTSEERRWTFSIDLPFGTATVKLVRSWEDCPRSFRLVKDDDKRRGLRSLMRCMLIVTVQVDLERFSFDGHTLPQMPAHWSKENLKHDPYKLIWDAFRFDTWLNWPLLTNESQIIWDSLNEEEQELMRAYLNPGNIELRYLPELQGDKAPAEFRSALINKAFVDVQIPWCILRNNHSRVLGPMLEYENRLELSANPLLSPHTLSRETIGDARTKLTNALRK
jgi:hypothetical protein